MPCPADLFRCIARGDAEIVTDHLDTFTADGLAGSAGTWTPTS